MTVYIEIAESELDRGPVQVEGPGGPIGIFRVEGQVFAIDNLCPHAHAALTEGFVDDMVVECAYHNARFQLSTGRCLRGPGGDVRAYPVRRGDGQIRIDVRRQSANPGIGDSMLGDNYSSTGGT